MKLEQEVERSLLLDEPVNDSDMDLEKDSGKETEFNDTNNVNDDDDDDKTSVPPVEVSDEKSLQILTCVPFKRAYAMLDVTAIDEDTGIDDSDDDSAKMDITSHGKETCKDTGCSDSTAIQDDMEISCEVYDQAIHDWFDTYSQTPGVAMVITPKKPTLAAERPPKRIRRIGTLSSGDYNDVINTALSYEDLFAYCTIDNKGDITEDGSC